MSQIEMSYEDLKMEMIKEIEKQDLIVLATSEGESVTARTVMCVNDGLTIYCGTKKNSRKYKQLTVNPNVALASRSLQIEGVATLGGHPLEEGNSGYLEAFKKQQPIVYENQSKRGNFENPYMRVIEITPKRIAMYVQGATAPESYLAILEPMNKKAYKLTREGEQF